MRNAKLYGSRVLVALLLSVSLALPACAGGGDPGEKASASPERPATTAPDRMEETTKAAEGGGTTVEAVLPEDILSEEERTGPPKLKDWNEPSGAEPIQIQGGGSAGTIPAVKPFNFGRDPGGPADKTMYLTVPKLGLYDVPVFDGLEEEQLKQGTIHVPATGFPWQEGANTYIAGHRIGYPGTPSDQVFYYLEDLAPGDRIVLKDSAGVEYVYSVTGTQIVAPDNVEVMNAVPGRSIISLQTCTLPDYSKRVVVQGELV